MIIGKLRHSLTYVLQDILVLGESEDESEALTADDF